MKTRRKLGTTGILLATLLVVVLLASCTVPVEPTPPTAGDLYLDRAPVLTPAQGKGEPLDVQVFPVELGGTTGHPLAWSFAILSDVHADLTKLQKALDQIGAMAQDKMIKFVLVTGDLIQGEKATGDDYRTEFQQVKDKLDTFQTDSGIPYIPLIGNHEVWCNLSGDYITLPDGTKIPPYELGGPTTTKYPEEIFNNEVFGSVYESLKNGGVFTNWEKQQMPAGGLTNPKNYPYAPTTRVPTYLQNLAFDYGSWHFVCLDFCARDDFDPDSWDFETNLPNQIVHPPYEKCQFGYASLLSQYENDATINWLINHLSTYTGNRNIFLLGHHPPVFELYSDLDVIAWYCHMVDHNTFGFSQTEYAQLVSALNNAATYNCAYHYWFTGHYHEASMGWGDITIKSHPVSTGAGEYIPVTQIGVIPSVLKDDWTLMSGAAVKINGAYNLSPQANNNGYIGVASIYEWPTLQPVT